MADFNVEELWQSFQDVLNQNNVPEMLLGVMGVLTLALVFAYRSDKDSLTYKVLVGLGVLFGAFMVYVAVAVDTGWTMGTLVVCILTCFALIIRPLRDVPIALIFSMIMMAIVYVYMGTLDGTVVTVFGFNFDVSFLAVGTARLIAALIVGAFIYMVTNFVEAIAKLVGKILNAWPFLLVISVWCILETIMLFAGYGSIFDFVTSFT